MRSRSFCLLIEGSVAIELRTPNFPVCVQALKPGDVFGWSALLARHDTLFQVRSRERTVALKLDGAELSLLCRANGQLGAEVLRRTLQVVARG